MNIQRAYVTHIPERHAIFVKPFDRHNGQNIASFSDDTYTVEDIALWVRSTSGLQLVCAISGIPI